MFFKSFSGLGWWSAACVVLVSGAGGAANAVLDPAFVEYVFPQEQRMVVIPPNPTTDDAVTVTLFTGRGPSNCTPTFTTNANITERTIHCLSTPCCYTYTLDLEYEKEAGDEECEGSPYPCRYGFYGPVFSLGKLKVGPYSVVERGEELGEILVSVGKDGLALSGTVNEDTRPLEDLAALADVKVYLLRPERLDMRPSSGDKCLPPTMYFTTVDSAVTGSGGEFVFDDRASGDYRIVWQRTGYQTYTQDMTLHGDTSLSVRLLPEGLEARVRGSVSWTECPGGGVDAPCVVKPLPGSLVSVILPQGSPSRIMYDFEPLFPDEISGEANEDGEYVIEGIPVTYHNQPMIVKAFNTRFAGPSQDVTFLPNALEAEVDFQLVPKWVNSASILAEGIRYTVTTDRAEYETRDRLAALCRAVNVSGNPVDVTLRSKNHKVYWTIASKGGTEFHILGQQIYSDDREVVTLAPGDSIESALGIPLTDVITEDTVVVTGIMQTLPPMAISVPVVVQSERTVIQSTPCAARTPAAEVSVSDGRLHVNLRISRRLEVSGFMLDGTRVLHFPRRRFDAGAHGIVLGELPAGVVLVRISGDGFSKTVKAWKHEGLR